MSDNKLYVIFGDFKSFPKRKSIWRQKKLFKSLEVSIFLCSFALPKGKKIIKQDTENDTDRKET